jgi:pilus assembly protein CpaC
MDKHTFTRLWLPLAAVLMLAIPASAQQTPLPPALPPAGSNSSLVYKVGAAGDRLEMTVHTSRILTMDQKVPQAQVNNPDVLTLTPLSPNQIQISAKTTGVTQVNLWGEDRKLHTIDVIVYGDAQELAMILRTTFPNAVLKVVPVSNAVLISGFVDKPEHIARIVQIAEEYYPKVINNMTVGGVQLVLLHVKVMEVSRTKLRQLGFDFSKITGSNFITSGVSGLLTNALDTSKSFSPGLGMAGTNTLAFGVVNGNNAFYGVLDALRQDNLLKISSEPTLSVISGQEASFNSGGQIPVPEPQSLGTISVDWKTYGTMIKFVPIVLGNGKIRMDVRPEISELDEAHSLTINGTTVPGILTRNTQTTVEMQAGQTLAIAGLVQYISEGVSSGLPWISEVPYLGTLFRNIHNQTNEIELLILVTPELADPLNASEVPPCGPGSMTTDPSDWELFMKGYLEVPKCCPSKGAAVGPGYRSGPAVAPPPGGMMLGPPESVPNPPPVDAANKSTSDGAATGGANAGLKAADSYNRYTSTKPDNTPPTTAPATQNNPPGLIGPSGYDVVK